MHLSTPALSLCNHMKHNTNCIQEDTSSKAILLCRVANVKYMLVRENNLYTCENTMWFNLGNDGI